MTDPRHVRGRDAERLARDFLIERGLEPLDRNWSRRLGEIDLVMREPRSDTIVFVEVRYRSGTAGVDGVESIDHRKQARLRRSALAWLQHHRALDRPARIDVIGIGPATIDWIPNAIEDDG